MTKRGSSLQARRLGVRTLQGVALTAGLALIGSGIAVAPVLSQSAPETKPDSAEMRGSHGDMRGSHGGDDATGAATGDAAKGVAAGDAAKPEKSEAKGSETDHSQMDHGDMRGSHGGDDAKGGAAGDPSQMDHSQMDHSMHGDHGGHKMVMDAGGMVMNWNDDTPPRDCKDGVSEDVEFTVRAGRKYAQPGQSFGYDVNEWQVKPCARVKITMINEDKVRHQWMMHGLPRYLYDQSMFHLEAAGGQTRSGTFIVPSGDETLLVHCDMAQHMEKGLKGQFKIGAGNGDLPSVPGITAARVQDRDRESGNGWQMAILLGGLLVGVGIGGGLLGRNGKNAKNRK